jgi:SM-20-related protein
MTAVFRTQGPSGDDTFARIADSIRTDGYVVVNDFLPQPLLYSLFTQIKQTDEQEFKRAGIGRDNDFHVNSFVRGDHIKWLNGEGADDGASAYFDWMEELRLYLNRELLLGLFDYECHYAYYPENAFYKKHVDAFRGTSNRRLSTVLYLNPAWQPDNGGELVLYSEDSSGVLLTVPPSFGTMVLFLSEVFPHEVLPTRKSRYSLTGWFRVNEPSLVL